MRGAFKHPAAYARVEGEGMDATHIRASQETHLETKRSHDAFVDGQRGIGPELDESILAETQVLKTEIALPKAQLYMVESMTEFG